MGVAVKRVILLGALVASPAYARHYHDHFTRDVIIGASINAAARPPYIINTGPVASLTPSGPGGPAGAVPVADELGKMASLRDRGILSEQEFQQQKAKLLGGPQ
jgi:hypothetical protein